MKYLPIKALKDNYIWVIMHGSSAIAVDCGESEPLLTFLTKNKLRLEYILVTHHHGDHTYGLTEVKEKTNCKVIAGEKTAKLVNKVDIVINEEQPFNLLGFSFHPIASQAHTLDHIMFYEANNNWLFSGDVLFSLGCGFLFEGTPEGLYLVMEKVKKLPSSTLVFAGHEYTKNNLEFVESLGFFNTRNIRDKVLLNDITLPSVLKNELLCNPYLNITNLDLKKYLQKEDLNDIDFAAHLRYLKKQFDVKKRANK